VQQQVRSGAITAHVAMKFLVPVARSGAEDCCRMAEGFARHRLRSREAGQLYVAWRGATAAVRQRLLADPQLFLKTQRQHEKSPAAPALVELSRDLDVVIAMMRRANRRLRGATVELDPPQCAQTQSQIRLALEELNRLAIKLPQPSATEELRSNREHESHEEVTNLSHQGGEDAESESTRGDPGDACEKTEQPCDRAVVEGEPLVGARGVAAEHDGGSALERAEICEPYRQQIIELLPRCKSNLVRVQEELAAIGATLSYSALTAFCLAMGSGRSRSWPRDVIRSSQESNFSTTALRTRWKWRASSTRRKPRRRFYVTRACCSSRSIPPSRASTARSS